jgi:hypothetical protein
MTMAKDNYTKKIKSHPPNSRGGQGGVRVDGRFSRSNIRSHKKDFLLTFNPSPRTEREIIVVKIHLIFLIKIQIFLLFLRGLHVKYFSLKLNPFPRWSLGMRDRCQV